MPKNIDEILSTIDLAKQALSSPQMLNKDATTAGYIVGTGLVGYNLEAPAKSLFPVLTPFRNRLPRVKALGGATNCNWRAITGINTTNQRATTIAGRSGALVSTTTKNYNAPYKVISLGDTVQFDAENQAKGYQDIRATATMNLLWALMIQEDIISLGGQTFTLGTPSAPSLTVSTTGGSIGAVTPVVKVAARTLQGYYDGKGTIASAQTSAGTLTGAANKITATVTAKPGAVCYDWYVGLSGGTLYYYTTTTINTATITTIPTSAGTVPTTLGECGTPPTTPATTDESADAQSYNGFLATLIGDYSDGAFVQNGTATSSGSYIKSLDGAELTGSNGTISQIDEALGSIWESAKLSPDRILVNAKDSVCMSNKIIASGGAYVTLSPTNTDERKNVVGGQIVTKYLNKYTGTYIDIETQPHLPQGTIAFETNTIPYPVNGIDRILEIETLQEYQQIDYATARNDGTANGGPRADFEVRSQQVLKNYFPKSMGVIYNVKEST